MSTHILWVCGFKIGFLNVTVNFVSNDTLYIQWEKPLWDTRNITRGVEINCSDTSQEVTETRNISDFEITVTRLNLNAMVTCCQVLLTTEGTGPLKCGRFSLHCHKDA